MTIQNPYNFRRSGNNTYVFLTDTEILYSVEFTDGSYYFSQLPYYLNVFEFSINVLSAGENISPPHDKRVEATVVKILSTFLSFYENAVIYICQNLDDRHHVRKRKFDMWFKQNANDSLEKYDMTVEYDGVEFLTSLIIHKNNSHKEDLIELFLDQPNQLGK